MRGVRWILGLCGAPLSVLATLGCEAEAGEGYTGEPLFSLKGEVIISEPGAGELVPALAFISAELTLVAPEVRGDFPARFRLDVMAPPPESAFVPPEFHPPELRGRVAQAAIVVVPREHPGIVPTPIEDTAIECTDDGTVCTRHTESCLPDDRCLQRTLHCVREDCPVISSTAPGSDHLSDARSSTECMGQDCMTVLEYCGDGRCERQIRKCDLTRADAMTSVRSNGKYEICAITAQTGDASVAFRDYIEVSVLSYVVIYLTEANDIADVFDSWERHTELLGDRLGPGYHLFEVVQPSDEEWTARLHCEHDSVIAALNHYNELHGTEHNVADGYGQVVEAAIQPEIERLTALCPPGKSITRLVKDPLNHDLTLRIGKHQRTLF